MIADRDFNVEQVESTYHVAGLANVSDKVNQNGQKKRGGKNKRRKKRHKTDQDLEQQLAEKQSGLETDGDDNDDHIDFRA